MARVGADGYMTAGFDQTITVILPTFNRSSLLVESLESILAQTIQPDRIIVVNDGSTDDTEPVLAPYRGRIEYIYQENAGKPAALNNALGRIENGWVWVFDDDDIALPNALELHVQALTASPWADFTYSAFWFAKTGNKGGLDKLTFEPVADISKRPLFDALLDDCVLSVQGMLVKIECYRTVGGYDSDLKRAEDYEFFIRLSHVFEGVGIEEPTYLRRVHEGVRGSGSNSHDARDIQAHFLKYEALFFEKLFRDLPLSSYGGFPCSDETDSNESAARIRRSHLKRASCMFRKGLWNNGLEDLRVLDKSDDARPLTAEEKRICFKAFYPELIPSEIGKLPDILSIFRHDFKSDLLGEVKVELARGITSRLLSDMHSLGIRPLPTWIRIARYFGIRSFVSGRLMKLRRRVI